MKVIGVTSDGLKLQCVTIATFLVYSVSALLVCLSVHPSVRHISVFCPDE